MIRRLLAVLVVGVTLAACETSNIDSSAAVTVTGRVLGPDGGPVAGVAVGLEREPSVGEMVGGLFIIPLTFFTACLADPAPAICRGRDLQRTTTSAAGTYAFNMTGRKAQTAFGNAADFTLVAAVPAANGERSGASVSAGFKIQTENLVLPDLQVWQPVVIVAPGRVTWSPPAGGGAMSVSAEDAGGQHVWTFDATRSELTFDPRILEDTSGTLAVSARTSAGAEGTDVSVTRRSGRVPYRNASGPPASRGRPCTIGVPVAPCVLTDGDFANRLPRPALSATTSSTTPEPQTATVDLGRSIDVSLVVVRGCACQVERSTDGQAWTAVGRSTGNTAIVPSRAAAARYIRLTGPGSDLREVSVWEGPAPAAAAAAPAPPPAETLAPPGASVAAPAPASAEPSRTAPALIALGLLLLVAIGTGAGAVALRRR